MTSKNSSIKLFFKLTKQDILKRIWDGLDSLLSTVQMPSGIPVATVAIDGAENAAILAVQILAVNDEELAAKLAQMKIDMENAVLAKDAKLNS